MKYIDADKLIAEIERYIKDVKDAEKRLTPNMGFFDAKLSGIYDVMSIVDSLQQEQKSAEWSEEDNIGWDEAFACVTRAEKAAKNEEELQNAVTAEKWLKEIKFKYYVHPVKQEWSEEDEAMRDNILRLLSCFVGTSECESNPSLSTLYPAYQREMDWLKSLKPQRR